MIKTEQLTIFTEESGEESGFSFIEISLVLVIIGLVVGGVLVGRSLIHTAELRSVVSEYQRFQTVTNAFKNKFNSLPGDMPNATAFWGAANSNPAACLAATGTGTQTCNGDGNYMFANTLGINQYSEEFMYWQHLYNAGFLDTPYTGKSGPNGASDAILGTNVPRSRMPDGGWSMDYDPYYSGDPYSFAFDYQRYYRYGSKATNSLTHAVLLTPHDAWNVDSKIDDGKPGDGRVIAFNWDFCTNAPSNGDPVVSDRVNSIYLVTATNILCALAFTRPF
ncbi:MAG: hypothetical protein SFX19_00530 [Alphaproteobacteria bacterium]|nr:hypothetical protein [Alphaproteobacteria bacterium]